MKSRPRAAHYAESAWHSCGVVAQLYPEKSTDLANFLIAFSRRLRGGGEIKSEELKVKS
jgi:hypothetical protein